MTKSNITFIIIGVVFLAAVVYQSFLREKQKDTTSDCGCSGNRNGGAADPEAVAE